MSGVPEPVWAIGGVIVLTVSVYLCVRWWERRRTAALEQVALRMGTSFLATDPSIYQQPFAQLPLMRRGAGGEVKNVARGDGFYLFDFRYTTGAGRNRTIHDQTVAAFERSRPAPAFELAPEGFVHKIAAVFGGQDLDFPDDPDFSSRFRLRGEDEAGVRKLFHGGVRQLLVDERRWSLEGEGDWVIAFRAGRRTRPDRVVDYLEQARRLCVELERG